MRSIWKGNVSFGLVNVPVKLYGATEEHDVDCHQVHKADGARIRYKRVCEDCGVAVETADIAKQYEHDGHTVILTEDELGNLPSASDRTIEVLEFVPAGSLDTMLYEKSYFLGPDKSDKAYTLLATALADSKRVALVRFAMRDKTRLGALSVLPKEGVLVVNTLRWADEIRNAADVTIAKVEVKPEELEMAGKLIASMENEYNADRYRDTYQAELRELITAKATGGELPALEAKATEDVGDLLAALEASIAGRVK